MFAHGRAQVFEFSWSGGKEGHRGGHGDRSGAGVVHGQQVAPGGVMRVAHDVRDGVDRAAGHLPLRAGLHHLVPGEGGRPIGDDPVDLVPRGHAGGLLAEGAVRGQLGPADRFGQAGEHLVVGAGDGHPLSVAGGVMAVGHRVVGVRPHSLANVPRGRIHRRQLVQEAEHGLVQPDVDHLPLARALLHPQRQQYAIGAVDAGEIVGQGGGAGHQGRRVRLAGEVGQPAESVGDAGEAGQ